MLREQTALVERATEGLVEQLLPGARLASSSRSRTSTRRDDEKVRKGVELVYAELLGVLEKAGLERIEARRARRSIRTSTRRCMQDDGDGEPRRRRRPAHRLPAQGPGAAARDGEGHAR